MNAETDPLPNQTRVGWQVASCLAVLLVALSGLIYFHYRPVWSGPLATFIETERADILWTFGGVALLALLGLFWIIHRQTRHRSDLHLQRAQYAEDTAAQLRAEIRAACNADTDAEHPIAQWRAGQDAQRLEINQIAQEIASLADALSHIREAAVKSAERIRHCAGNAEKGVAAVQNALTVINDTRNRIEEAAERIKHLAQNTRQFSQTVDLIRDVTEQSSVLSINAALRVGLTEQDEATESAEEMRRLNHRAARSAEEITECVAAILRDADEVRDSLQATAGQSTAGTAPTNEAARALAEIESASRELLEFANQAASEVAGEGAHAQTIGEMLKQLHAAAEQSGEQASQVAERIEKLKAAGDPRSPER